MITRRFLLAGMAGSAAFLAASTLPRMSSLAGDASKWEKADDLAIGAREAPITVIEYFSLTCPHCRNFHTQTFSRLRTEFIDTGKVRFIFRDFPLNRPALDAAILAHCAGPERYLAFVETLFNTFDNWTRAADYGKSLDQIGLLGGVSEARYGECLDDKALENKILSTMLEAQETYDVKSTPTFIINGEKYEGNVPLATFSKAFDRLLPET